MGRKPLTDHRIGGESLEEVKDGLDDERKRLSRLGLLHEGHVIWSANLVNGLACWFLSQAPGDRERVAREGLEEFARHLAADGPIPFAAAGPPARTGSGRSPRQEPARGGEGDGEGRGRKPRTA